MSVCLYLAYMYMYVRSFRLVSRDRHFSTLGHFYFVLVRGKYSKFGIIRILIVCSMI